MSVSDIKGVKEDKSYERSKQDKRSKNWIYC